MRLEKIKLAGFKSFVDPTTIPFTSDMVGIVGPNGCGKSNVIDAVRWVMGESSAKHLRGDQMADVIFNGSSTRKPIGQAFVELVFDNCDGTIKGEFASYRQISLKRQINREGQSVYFLNGTRCRRKDITDLFLGTGLGPRSYAIIEQGTISRLVEAKPVELRVFLEEAAGISKYKERRRDTENRMRRTKENLERIADLCDEIEKQCRHLKRQAGTASRYKALKAEERQLKAQLLVLRWQALHDQDEGQHKKIQAMDLNVEEILAGQRGIEKNIEHKRESDNEQREKLNKVQAKFYSIGSDIVKVEQTIQHHEGLKQQQLRELNRFKEVIDSSQKELAENERKAVDSSSQIKASELSLVEASKQEDEAKQSLIDTEQAMTDWQKTWDEFTYQVAEPKRTIDVEKAKISHLEKQIILITQRLSNTQSEQIKLQQSLGGIDLADLQKQHDLLEDQHQKGQGALRINQESISHCQQLIHEETEALASFRSEHSKFAGRMESIQVLQQANLGDSHEKVGEWLTGMGLSQSPRLIEKIDVLSGWEKAVETVLGSNLQAVCVDDVEAVLNKSAILPAGDLTLFEAPKNGQEEYSKTSLASIVTSDLKAMEVLKTVHMADSFDQAQELVRTLENHESVITKDGIWLNTDTVCFQANGESNSVLVLEKEKKELTLKLKKLSIEVSQKDQALAVARLELKNLEQQSRELRQQEGIVVKQVSQLAMQINDKRSKVEQGNQRLLQVEAEITRACDDQEKDNTELASCKEVLEGAIVQSAQLETKRESLQQQRARKKGLLDDVRRLIHSSRELTHSLLLKIESQRSSQALVNQSSQVLNERMQQAVDEVSVLQGQLGESDGPLVEQQAALDELLKERLVIDEHLIESRIATEAIEQAIRALEAARHEAEQLVQQARENSSAAKISHQEVLVRKRTLVEQMQESGVELAETLSDMPEEANDAQWQEQVDHLAEKINRLGLINLTAIEEYEAQSERKQYLDSQQLDLSESLKILSAAIEKIDKESRTLFKQTFDKVNEGFEKRFPKLFGGGHAYLQQMGEDLLESGVTVMARPPGKRNSSIHMLSGGEKALTAVALVFSIFDLNPSPFCMLDEVDAPLDEANVGRFGELVKEMSSHVQMILITHNKATMEMASQLSGVTMKEPGVSRLVTVDLDQATNMVAS